MLIRHVMAFFKSLFTNEDSIHSTLSTQAGFPPPPDHVLEPLSRTPDAQEVKVKQVICSMGSLKAPGVDGFPPLFYHEHWDTMGPSLTRFVQDAFTSPIYLDEKTLIVLIPKRKREPRESDSIYANFFVQCGL